MRPEEVFPREADLLRQELQAWADEGSLPPERSAALAAAVRRGFGAAPEAGGATRFGRLRRWVRGATRFGRLRRWMRGGAAVVGLLAVSAAVAFVAGPYLVEDRVRDSVPMSMEEQDEPLTGHRRAPGQGDAFWAQMRAPGQDGPPFPGIGPLGEGATPWSGLEPFGQGAPPWNQGGPENAFWTGDAARSQGGTLRVEVDRMLDLAGHPVRVIDLQAGPNGTQIRLALEGKWPHPDLEEGSVRLVTPEGVRIPLEAIRYREGDVPVRVFTFPPLPEGVTEATLELGDRDGESARTWKVRIPLK